MLVNNQIHKTISQNYEVKPTMQKLEIAQKPHLILLNSATINSELIL